MDAAAPTSAVAPTDHSRVIETLRAFNDHYLRFLQNMRGARVDNRPRRPDLNALIEMKNNGTILHPEKRIGSIPGIDVGHRFFSRAEMVVVGLHYSWLNGIDYIRPLGETKIELMRYKLPLAVSIVMMWQDGDDDREEFIYTGEGGIELVGNRRESCDQKLDKGNLGLKNSMEQSVPVRVIRGRVSPNSYSGTVYTFDGHYKVVKYWAELGDSGFRVFKFRLTRIEGQQPLPLDVDGE